MWGDGRRASACREGKSAVDLPPALRGNEMPVETGHSHGDAGLSATCRLPGGFSVGATEIVGGKFIYIRE
jgi:hypothetical protein